MANGRVKWFNEAYTAIQAQGFKTARAQRALPIGNTLDSVFLTIVKSSPFQMVPLIGSFVAVGVARV